MTAISRCECHIGLGSNLGDRAAYLAAAVAALGRQERVQVGRASGVYETAPVGGPPGQQPYLNMAISVVTSLSAPALLECCQRIERRLGRERTVLHGPRTADLDLLLFGERIEQTDMLTLPHPRMHLRRFVLEPLAEIAPEALHPVLGRTVGELLARLDPGECGGRFCRRVAEAPAGAMALRSVSSL